MVIYIKNKINKKEYYHLGIIEIGYYNNGVTDCLTAIVIRCYKKIKTRKYNNSIFFYISLFNTIDEIKHMFIDKNKSIQVEECVLEADSSNINLYKEIRQYLLYNYPLTFKEGNVRKPHINIDIFINDVKKYGIDKIYV